MKKLYFIGLLLCATLLSSGAKAAGYYTWEENYSYRPNIPQNYVAIRAGYSMISGNFNNTIGNSYTTYVRACDGSWDETTGECDGTYVGYGASSQFNAAYDLMIDGIAFWKEYDVDSELDANTGRLAVAFGGYLSSNRNIRVEGEFNKYMTFEHDDNRAYIGYQKETLDSGATYTPKEDVDDAMAVSYTSTIDSSNAMLNVYYDFNDGYPKKGSFTPFVGFGVGIAINKVQFALKDQEKEFETFLKTYIDENGIYPTTTTTKESLAWALMLGGTYVLNRNTSLELGLRYSNIGSAEWAFDEYQSFFEAEEMISTEMFMGLKFNF